MTGFLLGLMMGSALSGSPQEQQALSQIPLRCLGIFEKSIEEYKECRKPTLAPEISKNYGQYCADYSDDGWHSGTIRCLHKKLDQNLEWEVNALTQMVELAKKAKSEK